MSSLPRLLKLASPKLSGYCPHKPSPHQAAFLILVDREAFYGGAAGGGKSDALLMAALQHVDRSGYAALILRRTYKDLALSGAIMDRAKEWLIPQRVHWNENDKVFTFPSGATLTFGYLDTEQDKYRYQGAEFQFIGFDELTQFTEAQYSYLLSRLRRTMILGDVPLRMRSAGNPGGIGNDWVKARFIDSGPERPFIPAKLEDNPHLDQAAYRASLAGLDDVTRAQLEHGDWNVAPAGDLFSREWFRQQVDPYTAELRIRAWDLAATSGAGDYTVGVRMAKTEAGTFIVEGVVRGQWDVGTRDQRILQTAQRDGQDVTVVLEEEGGSSGKSQTLSLTRLLAGYTVQGERPTGPKDVRARPFASQIQVANARYLPGGWNSTWVNELVAFPTGAHDDQVDATSAAFNALAADTGRGSIWFLNER